MAGRWRCKFEKNVDNTNIWIPSLSFNSLHYLTAKRLAKDLFLRNKPTLNQVNSQFGCFRRTEKQHSEQEEIQLEENTLKL